MKADWRRRLTVTILQNMMLLLKLTPALAILAMAAAAVILSARAPLYA